MGKMLKKFFKGFWEKKVSWTLITAGIATLVSAFTENLFWYYIVSFLNETTDFHLVYKEKTTGIAMLVVQGIVGAFLIITGIIFYFKTRERNSFQTMVQVRHSSIEAVNYSEADIDLSEYHIEPFPIHLVDEIKNLSEDNLRYALREQEKIAKKINHRIDGTDKTELSYWGLAHIPLMFQLGYQVADKTNSSFFEWNQNRQRWEKIQESSKSFPPLLLSLDEPFDVTTQTEVVIKIGITYPVFDSSFENLGLDGTNRFNLQLETPKRNAIVSKQQIDEYKATFRDLLDTINKTYPAIKKIHIFYSGQPSLAYRLGSAISPRMELFEEVWVYNYLGGKYNWKIRLDKIDNLVQAKLIGEDIE
jgi:hypothetical protein